MNRLFVCLLPFFAISFARADDAAWMQIGDAGNFTKSKHIRMVQEHVWIAISNKRVRVHALFQFKNEGPAHTVKMAFPDGIEDFKPRKPSAPQAILWMKSKVDGKPAKMTRQRYKPEKQTDYPNYTHVWLKDVSFRKGQTRMVSVDYETLHGDRGDYIQDIYTLKTGATWKGSIGKAVIYIDWSALRGHTNPEIDTIRAPLYESVEPRMKKKEIGPRAVRLEFNHFEPDFDIEMGWPPTFWNFCHNGKPIPGLPITQEGLTFINGPGNDPKIYVESIEQLLSPSTAQNSGDVVSFRLRNKSLKVENNKLFVDGKGVKLRRGYEKDGELGSWIYIRDLVRALGGSYRYDSKLDRVHLRF